MKPWKAVLLGAMLLPALSALFYGGFAGAYAVFGEAGLYAVLVMLAAGFGGLWGWLRWAKK